MVIRLEATPLNVIAVFVGWLATLTLTMVVIFLVANLLGKLWPKKKENQKKPRG